MKPISPNEVQLVKNKNIPEAIIEIFNNLIVRDWDGRESRIYQDDVIALIEAKEISSKEVFENRWLDIESLFRETGWKVKYDKPGYNETYKAYWIFSK